MVLQESDLIEFLGLPLPELHEVVLECLQEEQDGLGGMPRGATELKEEAKQVYAEVSDRLLAHRNEIEETFKKYSPDDLLAIAQGLSSILTAAMPELSKLSVLVTGIAVMRTIGKKL